MSMEGEDPRPDQEGFGEASLGEAQSSDPPSDPEMIEGESANNEGAGAEEVGGDQDAEPTATPEQVEVDEERDQAEG